MRRVSIAQLSQAPLQFDDVYRIRCFEQRTARTGKNYLRITIEDATDTMLAYAWQQPANQNTFTNNTHMHIRGKSRFYNGVYVADIIAAEQVTPTPEQAIATLPCSQSPEPTALAELASIIANIQHDGLRLLLCNTFCQEHIALPFMQVPASLRYHHNYKGGLLVHSLECATIIRELSIFSQQDRELGITAALLHDLGKIKTIGINFSRPELGKAIDHEAITLEICAAALAQLDSEYPELAIDLRHTLTCRSIKRWGHEVRLPIAHALQLADRLSSDKSLHQISNHFNKDASPSKKQYING